MGAEWMVRGGTSGGEAVKLLTAAGLQREFDSLPTKMFLGRLSRRIPRRGNPDWL